MVLDYLLRLLTDLVCRYLEHRSFDPIGFSQSSVYTFMTEEEPVPFSPDVMKRLVVVV